VKLAEARLKSLNRAWEEVRERAAA
jgi:hypothetical protein